MGLKKPKQPRLDPYNAFLNIPYDNQFQNLYLAYISGLSAFGLFPKATLEIPGSKRRLDRIFGLIQTCGYSFHDLSRVQLDRKAPATPRFNMPFELGLAVAWAMVQNNDQIWFVFESVKRRVQKSLSDLDGTDIYIPDGTVGGIFRELNNALVRSEHRPTQRQMQSIYRKLKQSCLKVMHDKGAKSVFEASVFKELVVVAGTLAKLYIPRLSRTLV